MSEAEIEHKGTQLSYPPARRTALAVFHVGWKGAGRGREGGGKGGGVRLGLGIGWQKEGLGPRLRKPIGAGRCWRQHMPCPLEMFLTVANPWLWPGELARERRPSELCVTVIVS